jgi:hypothetical protein
VGSFSGRFEGTFTGADAAGRPVVIRGVFSGSFGGAFKVRLQSSCRWSVGDSSGLCVVMRTVVGGFGAVVTGLLLQPNTA